MMEPTNPTLGTYLAAGASAPSATKAPPPLIPPDVSVYHVVELVHRPAYTEQAHRFIVTRANGQQVSIVGASYEDRDRVLARALDMLLSNEGEG